MGSFARRLRALKGPAIAIKSTAIKLAIMYYNVQTKGLEYVEQGIEKYEKQAKETEIMKLTRWALKMGYSLSAT